MRVCTQPAGVGTFPERAPVATPVTENFLQGPAVRPPRHRPRLPCPERDRRRVHDPRGTHRPRRELLQHENVAQGRHQSGGCRVQDPARYPERGGGGVRHRFRGGGEQER